MGRLSVPRLVRGLDRATQGGHLWRQLGRVVGGRGVRVVGANDDPRRGWRVVFGDLEAESTGGGPGKRLSAS
ncbi:MAG: hypothetical protein OEQ13_01635 [Acidobacteriota bacterium]|nr:hypothetical protein [Acidobacteriota bacterium]